MHQVHSPFKKKQLALAVSVALLGGSLAGCDLFGSSSSSDGGAAYTITSTGGTAFSGGAAVDGGTGGSGGQFDLYNYGGTGGIEVLTSGSANAGFSSIIPTPTQNLGTNPLMVTANTTVQAAEWDFYSDVSEGAADLYAGDEYIDTNGVLRTAAANGYADYTTDLPVDEAGRFYMYNSELYEALDDGVAPEADTANLAAAGTPYLMVDDFPSLFIADNDDATADLYATGISVASGATLTFEASKYGFVAALLVENDIVNHGTITTGDTDFGARGGLWMMSKYGSYTADGNIDTSGSDTVADGGEVVIGAAGIYNSGSITTSGGLDGDGGFIDLYSAGYLKNSGALTANGGAAYGGSAGNGASGDGINLYAAYIENSGAISANGGAGIAGSNYSGYGGSIWLEGTFGTNNSAAITTTGGDGGEGGRGGYVGFSSSGWGDTRNSGAITTTGGNASADGVSSYGGHGGNIWMDAYAGDVISNAALDTSGGTSYAYGGGADGGDIEMYTYSAGEEGCSISQTVCDLPPGSIVVSGNLDLSGGDDMGATDASGYGGDGGEFFAMSNDWGNSNAGAGRVALLGYSSVNLNGGDGRVGGDGGDADIDTDPAYNSEVDDDTNGSVVNQVAINAMGGNAIVVDGVTTSASGGDGGDIWMDTDGIELIAETTLTNSGAIDVSGGSSYAGSGGYGGNIDLDGGTYGTTNSASLTANGGADLATDAGNGGDGGQVALESEYGPVANSGAISANGGDGAMSGGDTRDVYMWGTTVSNSGSISFNGGDAVATVVGSTGGFGGGIGLFGFSAITGVTTNSGSLAVGGGAGEEAGSDGCIAIGLLEYNICNSGPF